MSLMCQLFVYCVSFSISILNCQQLPSWTAPQPNANKPLGGYTAIDKRVNTEIFHGTSPNDTSQISGAYNHAPMIGYYHNIFIVLWKNCQKDEDCNGQRILYSQSEDGTNWTFPQIMFPNLTTPKVSATQFVGPPIIINDHLYVASSPGVNSNSNGMLSSTADGAQFCLWPEPINPRNCGPPNAVQYNNTLMMRRVFDDIGRIGPLFWAGDVAPKQFEEATEIFNIPTINQMDISTQNDISLLTKEMRGFCVNNSTLKCEICENGCQLYSDINVSLNIKNERSHYILPSNKRDIILYRQSKYQLYVSYRNRTINQLKNETVFGNWTYPELTNIPNDDTNLNTGYLPNGKIYLISNPVYPNASISNIKSPKERDPITIATSSDGLEFNKVAVIMTCTNLSTTSTCSPRYEGKGLNYGPSYPQALTVINSKYNDINGIYVVASNNKEDIWITKVSFSDIP